MGEPRRNPHRWAGIPVQQEDRDGKLVTYARLQTTDQVDRANRLNEELYGPEFVGGNRIEARPYMGPALEKEMPNLPVLWANSVK